MHGSTRALPLREVGSDAMRHAAAPELSSVGWHGLEPRDTWWHHIPSRSGGEVQGRGTRDSAGAHLDREVRFGAVGHMAAPEPISTGRQGPELQDT
jgi:hypothetical protein